MTGRIGGAVAALAVVVAVMGSSASARTTTPTVEIRAVLSTVAPEAPSSSTLAPADRVDAGVKVATCDEAGVAQLAVVPTTDWHLAKPAECVVYPDRTGDARYLLGPAQVTTAGVKRARAELVPGAGWTVRLALTSSGSTAFDALAEQQFHHQVAFTASGEVVAAPTIQPNDAAFSSFGGTAVISGDFGRHQAERLAVLATPANRR